MEKEVADYIANAPEAQRLIMEMLLDLMREEIPDLKINFKWGRLVSLLNMTWHISKPERHTSPLAFLNLIKFRITLIFSKGLVRTCDT